MRCVACLFYFLHICQESKIINISKQRWPRRGWFDGGEDCGDEDDVSDDDDELLCLHDGVMKWKHFPPYWPFVQGIHRSPVDSPHKVQWRVAMTFSLIYARINGWINIRKAADLRRHRAFYDNTVAINTMVHIKTLFLLFAGAYIVSNLSLRW